MKPLYIAGTQQNVGKTTFSLGLIGLLRKRGMNVGYMKPVGQRVTTVAGHPVHDDALVVSEALALEPPAAGGVTVSLTHGRVEKALAPGELHDLGTPELVQALAEAGARLARLHDVVVVEGMGHAAVGSCVRLSAADVARILGARALLIAGGGIGRTIDDLVLCATFLTARGADLLGAVVNKVWPEKFDRVKEATTRGLANLGVRSFGTMPYEEVLSSPTVGQVAHELGARIICGTAALHVRVGKTVIAAMEAHHMVSYLKDRALVITPGDRSDNILAILSMHTLSHTAAPPVAAIILTGGFVPTGNMMDLLVDSGLPAMMCREDTFTLAAKLRETVFKITPDDRERVDAACRLIETHVDVDAILEGLKAP